MFDFDLLGLVAGIPGLIIALAIHEYSHAAWLLPWVTTRRSIRDV